MIEYQWHTEFLTGAAALSFNKVLGSNAQRVALVVAAWHSGIGLQIGFIMTKPNQNTTYTIITSPDTVQLPWRDYGPVICEEIWLQPSANTIVFAVTEVYRLPSIA